MGPRDGSTWLTSLSSVGPCLRKCHWPRYPRVYRTDSTAIHAVSVAAQCDMSQPAGWNEALNLVSAVSTLIWRSLALLSPNTLYPELAFTTPFVQRRYRLNLRSFSFFAAAICVWTLVHPADPMATALWISYFVFRQLNLAVTLHRIEPLLFAHDAIVVICYLVAIQAGSSFIVAAMAGSLLIGNWRSIARTTLSLISWTTRCRPSGISMGETVAHHSEGGRQS